MRNLTWSDRLLNEVQHFLDTLNHQARPLRQNPAEIYPEPTLDIAEQKLSRGCMRVNHTGEICAQALYRGQAFGTGNQELRAHFNEAAAEEVDHLEWCQERLDELKTHTSYLNPLWYFGSFIIGLMAARLGDTLSLGFVEETEQQVTEHLAQHQKVLPKQDYKSLAIVKVMMEDEARHAENARNFGAEPLPQALRLLMRLQSKVMTKTAYYF